MKVILLEHVTNLGTLGDVVEVKNGFARNFLIPKKKAMRATVENLEKFKKERAKYEANQRDVLTQATIRQSKLDGQAFIVTARAGVDGKLFGSITSFDIVEAIKQFDVDVKKSEIMLASPLKTLGEFEIDVLLHHDVHAKIKVNVTPEV